MELKNVCSMYIYRRLVLAQSIDWMEGTCFVLVIHYFFIFSFSVTSSIQMILCWVQWVQWIQEWRASYAQKIILWILYSFHILLPLGANMVPLYTYFIYNENEKRTEHPNTEYRMKRKEKRKKKRSKINNNQWNRIHVFHEPNTRSMYL